MELRTGRLEAGVVLTEEDVLEEWREDSRVADSPHAEIHSD